MCARFAKQHYRDTHGGGWNHECIRFDRRTQQRQRLRGPRRSRRRRAPAEGRARQPHRHHRPAAWNHPDRGRAHPRPVPARRLPAPSRRLSASIRWSACFVSWRRSGAISTSSSGNRVRPPAGNCASPRLERRAMGHSADRTLTRSGTDSASRSSRSRRAPSAARGFTKRARAR